MQARPYGARLRVDTEVNERRHQDQDERPIKADDGEGGFDANTEGVDAENVGLAYDHFSTVIEKRHELGIDPGQNLVGA